MAQPVTVVAGSGDTGADTSTAFAAGAATVVAAQAAETADTAAAAAVAAADAAQSAQATAYATQDQVSELRAEMNAMADRFMASFGELVELVTEEVPAGDGVAPEVIVNTGDGDVAGGDQGDGQAAKPKPKRERKFGSDAWFGDR